MTPRRPRWLLRSALALAALIALAFIAAALYGADPVRVVALLQTVLRSDFGLALSYEGEPQLTFWPRPGVALDDYRIDVVATGKPLAWGNALAIEVPWRALRSDRIEIERVALAGPVFHAAALEGWRLGAASGPIRWPSVGNGIVVEDAKYIGAGIPPRVIEGLDIEVSPLEPGVPATLRATWRGASGDASAIRIALDFTPVDAPEGLGLDALTVALSGPGDASTNLRGSARIASAKRWSIAGKLEAAGLPVALTRFLVLAGPQPATALDLSLAATESDWNVVADGTLAGNKVDADFRIAGVPDFDQPPPVWLAALQRDAHGRLRLERLFVGDVVLEDVELTNDDSAASDPPVEAVPTTTAAAERRAATRELP